jgi:hypothetical protein
MRELNLHPIRMLGNIVAVSFGVAVIDSQLLSARLLTTMAVLAR